MKPAILGLSIVVATLAAAAGVAAESRAEGPAPPQDAAAAQPLPLVRAAWEKLNPLGGEFEDGRYVVLHEGAPALEVARDVPASSNLVVEARFTPERDVPGAGNSAIAIFESPGRYWHLFLAKDGRGVRTFGLNELGGYAQLQSSLERETDEGADASWEWGRAYRLRLALGGGAVEGEVLDAETGARLFRRRYALAPGHVASGRPAFKLNRVLGRFEDVRCLRSPSADIDGRRQPSAPPAGGFYRTMRDDAGKWWFVDPGGSPMFLSGIGVVNHNGHYSAALGYAPYARTVARKYPTLEDWATNTLARIRAWGFNFLSSPSANLLHRGLPTAHVVNIGQDFACYGDEFDLLPCDGGPCSGFPNVFHPLWPDYCRYRAQSVCSHDRDDPWTLGWYIDNELSWWGDKRQFKTPPASGLFDAAAKKAPGHPARQALERFLAEHGHAGPASAAPAELKREFVRLCARKYFEAATAAIREADPNHLVLGCRFAGLPSADPVVWEECGRFCDAVSVNIYPMADLDRGVAVDWPGPNARLMSDLIGERARMAGKPVIVTEWSFSALDSGLPCTHGAGQRFFTQRERAEATSIFARTMWAMPEVAGYVYFMWCDQPAVGRSGPQSENTNYGLVNADDEPYEEQVAALAALQCHAEASRAAEVPRPREVIPPRGEDFAASLAESASHAENAESAESVPAFSGSLRLSVSAVNPHAESLVVAGKGVFSAMLREYSRGGVWWTAATEAVEADGASAPAPGARDVVFRGAAASGPFEVAMRFYEPERAGCFVAELLSVRNGGDRPLPFDAVFFRLLPIDLEGAEAARGDDVFEPPKAGQPTPIPPMLWRPWRSGAWILPDSTVLGLLSPRRTGVQIRFWKDANFHADAEMRYPRRELRPGETWTPEHRPFVIGSVLSGGEFAWRGFCASIRAGFTEQ